jgi:hypothetical protein
LFNHFCPLVDRNPAKSEILMADSFLKFNKNSAARLKIFRGAQNKRGDKNSNDMVFYPKEM